MAPRIATAGCAFQHYASTGRKYSAELRQQRLVAAFLGGQRSGPHRARRLASISARGIKDNGRLRHPFRTAIDRYPDDRFGVRGGGAAQRTYASALPQ